MTVMSRDNNKNRDCKGVLSAITTRFEKNRLGELLVLRGSLTPAQLHNALKVQKESGQALGTVLQTQGLVSKNQIRTTLVEQTAYRAVAACFTIFIGMTSFSVGAAKASSVSPRTTVTQSQLLQNVAFHPQISVQPLTDYPRLFGSREVSSPDITAFKKWTEVLARMDNIAFKPEKLDAYRGMSVPEMVSAVNAYVNQYRYIEDKDNYGVSDYWATPTEFFARGGDCEDFAIAKYAMLKSLGVPEDRMRLAIVQDKIKNIPHAVLIVYTDAGSMLLDNQLKAAVQTASVDRYKPIYSINSQRWWRHLT